VCFSLQLFGRGQHAEDRSHLGSPAGGLEDRRGGRIVVQQPGGVQLLDALFVALFQRLLDRRAALHALLGFLDVRLNLRRDAFLGSHPLDQLDDLVPLLLRDQVFDRLAPQQHFVDGRNVVQIVADQFKQVMREVADLLVGRLHQVAIQRRSGRRVEILFAEQDPVVFRLIHIRDPQVRGGGQRSQGHVDVQRGEVVETGKQQRIAVAARMLVRRQTGFQVAAADQRWHAHAIVIDQPEMAFRRNHDVAVLQIAVDDFVLGQLPHQMQPDVGRDLQRLDVPFAAAVARPLEQRDPRHPFHDQQRIQFAVCRRTNAPLVIVETDDAGHRPRLQIIADRPIVFQAFILTAIENTDRELATVRPITAIDRGKVAAAGLGLPQLVHFDGAAPQFRIAERHPGVLQDASIIGDQRPGRHGWQAGVECCTLGSGKEWV